MAEGFASMVSHESRTALTGIQGWSELIRDGDLTPEETRVYAQYIFRDAERINRLIGDMLDLNRLENDRAELRRAQLDVTGVVREAVELVRSAHDGRTITLELGHDLPLVTGDSDRLAQAVANLLRFALGHSSPEAEIVITSRCLDDQVEVSLQAGSLRSGDLNDWLIGRYERYENRPSQIIGAGLGLALARVIVELHGGRLWMGEAGATEPDFHLTLPIRRERAAADFLDRERMRLDG